MGQYFRLWLEQKGLFPENYQPDKLLDDAISAYDELVEQYITEEAMDDAA